MAFFGILWCLWENRIPDYNTTDYNTTDPDPMAYDP